MFSYVFPAFLAGFFITAGTTYISIKLGLAHSVRPGLGATQIQPLQSILAT